MAPNLLPLNLWVLSSLSGRRTLDYICSWKERNRRVVEDKEKM